MSRGLEALKKYRKKVLSGEIIVKKRQPAPSMRKSIRDNCKDCMNGFRDGRHDCEIEYCPFYYWMPYGSLAKERKRLKDAGN